MTNFIEKHKLFFLLLLSLITLAIGFLFVCQDSQVVGNIDSATYGKVSFTYYYTPYHSCKTTGEEALANKRTEAKYKNSEGVEFEVDFSLRPTITGASSGWYCTLNNDSTNAGTSTKTADIGDTGMAQYGVSVTLFSGSKTFAFSLNLTPTYDSDYFTYETNGVGTSFSESGTVKYGTGKNYIYTHDYKCVFYPIQKFVYFHASTTSNWSSATGYFAADGQQVRLTTVTAYERLIECPDTPTRDGYTFGDWYDQDGNAFSTSNYLTPDTATHYYAQWNAHQYRLDFYEENANPQDSSAITNMSVTFNSTVGKASVPSAREGYTFLGYYIGSTKIFDSNGNPVASVSDYTDANKNWIKAYSSDNYVQNLFAKWSENTYDIVFNANGGSGSMSKMTLKYTESRTLTANSFTKTGYSFAGWATSESGEIAYTNGQTVYSLTPINEATVNLYAKWTANEYTLYLNANGGSGGISQVNDVVYDSVYPTISSTAGWEPSRKGYSFTGYWTASSGGEQIYNDSGGLVDSSLTYTTAGDSTLYAQWRENTYNIAFNANGGSGSMSNMTGIKYTESKSLTKNAFTKTGYLFAGWATSASGGVEHSDEATVYSLTPTDGATVTLYAKWTPITYTVIYNSNGGTGTMSETEATYDSSFTLSANTFTCANKLFIGWATSASGGVTYKDQATITTNLASTQGATVNLYAVWLDTWANHGTTPRGSGTSGSPYLISTPQNLGWIAYKINNDSTFTGRYFKQTANINLGQYTWLPIGNTTSKFIGTYDGNGYAITNLNTSSATKANGYYLHSYSGLFGYVTKKDSVTKTTLKNINVLSGNIVGRMYVGAIVGRSEYATITGCNVYAPVHGYIDVGAICGYSYHDTISNCYSKTQISATRGAAGMFGMVWDSKISSCGFEGTSNDRLLIGAAENGVTVTDCFANSASDATFVSGSATITNCLFIANNTSSSPTKIYRGTDFSNWVIPSWVESTTADRTPLPTGLSWLAIGGEKVTGISQITALGYVSA